MKTQAAVISLVSLVWLVSTTLASPSWSDLAIPAPRFGRYLCRTNSKEQFFWQADTAWELVHKLNKTSIDFYLRARAEQGCNTVQTVVISENNETTRPNFYGDLPFNDTDTTQPIEAYFELIDWTVEQAASYGILMVLVPAWGNWISGGWHGTEESLFNESTAYAWGKYVGERYPGIPKILGGDTNCLWARNLMAASISYSANPDVDPATLVVTIEDTTVSIDAVQSGHATPESLGAFTPFEARDSTKNYELVASILDGFTGPVLDLENHYEGAHYNFNPNYPIWNASQVRTGLYDAVYSGSAGFTYGANSVWQMYEPRADLLRDSDYYSPSVNQNASGSWRRDIFFEGATQIQHVTKPLQNLSIEELELLEPARDLLASPSFHTDVAVNAYDSTRLISLLASKNRDRYYAYTGHGDSFSLKLGDGSVRSGTARWYSPREGQYYVNSTVDIAANVTYIDFTPPSTGGVDNDWLLVLEL